MRRPETKEHWEAETRYIETIDPQSPTFGNNRECFVRYARMQAALAHQDNFSELAGRMLARIRQVEQQASTGAKPASVKTVPWADVVRQHPWMAQFEGVRIIEDASGVWCFEMNSIVNDLYTLQGRGGLDLNAITIRQQQGIYSIDELLQLGMLLGLSIQGFADMFPECAGWVPKRGA